MRLRFPVFSVPTAVAVPDETIPLVCAVTGPDTVPVPLNVPPLMTVILAPAAVFPVMITLPESTVVAPVHVFTADSVRTPVPNP